MNRLKTICWGTLLMNGVMTIVSAFVIMIFLGNHFGWELPFLQPFFLTSYYIGMFAGLILFASWIVPVGIAAVMLMGLWRWVRVGKQPPAWALMLTAVVMMSLFTGRYEPLMQPHDDVDAVWVTEPHNQIMHSLKLRQAFFEMDPCGYDLLRWEETTLIYAERCFHVFERQFNYDAETGKIKRLLSRRMPWHDFPLTPVPSTSEVLSQAQQDAWFEISRGEFYQRIGWALETLPSDDGEWQAVVTENLFGPEDVVVVRP